MDLNKILILLRDSLWAVKEIREAVDGNVYSSYLSEQSKFPCITVSFIGGTSPANIDGVVLSVVQVKIWTIDDINYNAELYGIYGNITPNFHQNHYSNDILKMGCKLRDGDNSSHPAPTIETVNNIQVYSLPIKIQCRAIYA